MCFRALRVKTANTEFRRVRKKKKSHSVGIAVLLCDLSSNEIA